MIKTVESENKSTKDIAKEHMFDRMWLGHMLGRIDSNKLVDFLDEDTTKLTTEEVVEQSQQAIAKFQKKGV